MKTLSDKELRKQVGKMQGIAKNFGSLSNVGVPTKSSTANGRE